MNITFKSRGNTENMANFKPQTFHSSPNLSTFKNIPNKRPLEQSSQNLSFKGLFYTEIKHNFNAKKLTEIAKKHLGKPAEDLFNDIQGNKYAGKMFSYNGETGIAKFKQKTILKLVIDGMLYPFTTLPKDITNLVIGNLRKFKATKNWANKLYNSEPFKNIRQQSKIDQKVNAFRGLLEDVEKNCGNEDFISSELFQQSTKMFDPGTGNYDTKHERSLCRIVSGVIPAVFLANDAYNLSMMYKNDQKDAESEQKTRFKQEVVRVGANAYLMLVTLGALQKYINNSTLAIILNTGLTTLFTEATARLVNGKHLTRLTPEEAKSENAKKGIKFESSKNTNNENNKSENKKNDPFFNLSTLKKVCAGIIATGFAIKGLRKISAIDDLFQAVTEPISKKYKNLVTNFDYTVTEEEFKKVTDALKVNGFEKLAEKYIAVKGENKDGLIHLGSKAKTIKPFVNFLIAPFKFAFNTIKFPYTITDKLITGLKNVFTTNKQQLFENPIFRDKFKELQSAQKKLKDKNLKTALDDFVTSVKSNKYSSDEEIALELNKLKQYANKILDKDALALSIDKMIAATKKYNAATTTEEKELAKKEFESFVSDNMLKAFNKDNVSNIANNELANLAKTSATATTIWFLMTDNYNMAMLKSNGEDVDGAKEKFKGRFIQEGSRLFYQTLLIDLFNSTFKTQYNSSLWGMTWVTASNTLISEILNRKSIGMPVLPHSQTELQKIETEKQNATGFIKGYYDFMARLTGKKTLAEKKSEMK